MKRTVFAYPYVVWMALFIVAPMLLIVYYAFTSDGALSFANIQEALDPLYLGILTRSVWIALRATAVCRELETSDDPISVIAERHGFTSPKMLNQYFRELYGCTPSEKRKAFREMILDGVY